MKAVLGSRGRALRVAAALAACATFASLTATPALAKANAPVPAATVSSMSAKNMAPNAPILVRTFKKEAVLEVWKQTRGGQYALLKSFPICRWSGQLGPKRREGDRQTPEGFYAITPKQMNPNSSYYLSFDIGYPNAYDRAHGGSGAYLMVHGSCSSAGCYAMTDTQIAEIYALAREAFAGGQRAFQFQAFPFRMTPENLARHRSDQNIGFWRQLKDGYDHFEATRQEPLVSVADKRYVFQSRTPEATALAKARREAEDARIATLVGAGLHGIRTTYSDGGQNAIFAALAAKGAKLGDISRPEALAYAGQEVVVAPGKTLAASLAVVSRKAELAAAQARPAQIANLPEPAPATPRAFTLISGASPILSPTFSGWTVVALATH